MSRQFRTDDTHPWAYKYGRGLDGALTVSADATHSRASAGCAGTVSTKTLTLDSASSFANDDLVLIHQTRGTDAGKWELNRIVSGGGSTTLTLESDLEITYVDSGADQAQVIELKEYTSVTIDAGKTLSAPQWDGSKDGILAFLCNGSTVINGTLSAAIKGFAGGSGGGDGAAWAGEGTGAASAQNVTNPAGSGGGSQHVSSAGGGHASTMSGPESTEGTSVGTANGVNLNLGAGGGGTAENSSSGAGGRGGGIVAVFSKIFTVNPSTGAVIVTGGNGVNATRGGSGGAAGAILVKCQVGSLGTTLMTATHGNQGTGTTGNSTNGSDGRIHVDYGSTLSGTTSPTLDSSQDSILNDNGGAFLFNIMN